MAICAVGDSECVGPHLAECWLSSVGPGSLSSRLGAHRDDQLVNSVGGSFIGYHSRCVSGTVNEPSVGRSLGIVLTIAILSFLEFVVEPRLLIDGISVRCWW